MNVKLLSFVVSLGLALGMAGLGSAAEIDLVNEEDKLVAALDTPDGVETLTKAELDEFLEELDGHNVFDGCSGDAPLETSCTTGERSFVWLHGCLPGALEGIEYTGTIESRLVHDGDDRTFACTYDNGELTGTEGSGSFPSGTFVQEGYSYMPGMYGDDTASALNDAFDGEPNGLPGGIGHWAVVLI